MWLLPKPVCNLTIQQIKTNYNTTSQNNKLQFKKTIQQITIQKIKTTNYNTNHNTTNYNTTNQNNKLQYHKSKTTNYNTTNQKQQITIQQIKTTKYNTTNQNNKLQYNKFAFIFMFNSFTHVQYTRRESGSLTSGSLSPPTDWVRSPPEPEMGARRSSRINRWCGGVLNIVIIIIKYIHRENARTPSQQES